MNTPTTPDTQATPFFLKGAAAPFAACAALGAIVFGIGAFMDPDRAGIAWLTAFAVGATVWLGLLLFVLLQQATGARWCAAIRPLAERMLMGTGALLLLFLPLALLAGALYPAMHSGDGHGHHLPHAKATWLSQPFVLIRAVVYLAAWWWMARTMSRPVVDPAMAPVAKRRAAPFLVLLIITASMAAFDWLMAVDPHWFSTMFGPYVLAQGLVAALGLLILVTLRTLRGPHAQYLRTRQRHDLGKWFFAMAVFWGYLAFSQWFLIWYANIPEETGWMLDRWTSGYAPIGVLAVSLLFILPFVLLMPAGAKRRGPLLPGLATLALIGHVLGMVWIVHPVGGAPDLSGVWLDLAALLAVVGVLGVASARAFARHGAVTEADPDLRHVLSADPEEDEDTELKGVHP